jgi:osmotically-inducible protein OsmY
MRSNNQRTRDSRDQNQSRNQGRDGNGRYGNNRDQSYGNFNSRNSGNYYDDSQRNEDQNRQYDYFDEINPERNFQGYSSEGRGYTSGYTNSQYGGNTYETSRGENRGRDWGSERSWNQNEDESDYSQRGQRNSAFANREQSGQSYNSGSTYGEHRGKGPKGYQRSDERIQENINDQLTDDHELDASNIEVKVEQGEVSLSGSVANRESKRRAEDIAESVSGVKNVENRIKIASESSESKSNGSTHGKSEHSTSERSRTKSNNS